MQNSLDRPLYSPGLHFVSVSGIILSSSPRMLAEWYRCTQQILIHLPSYHFSHDTWLSSATPLSRAGHPGIWLMLSPSVVICLICPALWDVSKTSLDVSWAWSQLVSTLLAGWYLPTLLYIQFLFLSLLPVFLHAFPLNRFCFMALNISAEVQT